MKLLPLLLAWSVAVCAGGAEAGASLPEMVRTLTQRPGLVLSAASRQDQARFERSRTWLERTTPTWPEPLVQAYRQGEADIVAALQAIQREPDPSAAVAEALRRLAADYEAKEQACRDPSRQPAGPWALVSVRTIASATGRNVGGYTVSCGSFFRIQPGGAPYVWPAPTVADGGTPPQLRILVGQLRFWLAADPARPEQVSARVVTVPAGPTYEVVLRVD